MSDSSNDVIIAGAGIGGLTLALGLLRNGQAVQIVESAQTLSEVGAGISLPPNALSSLAPGLERTTGSIDLLAGAR